MLKGHLRAKEDFLRPTGLLILPEEDGHRLARDQETLTINQSFIKYIRLTKTQSNLQASVKNLRLVDILIQLPSNRTNLDGQCQVGPEGENNLKLPGLVKRQKTKKEVWGSLLRASSL